MSARGVVMGALLSSAFFCGCGEAGPKLDGARAVATGGVSNPTAAVAPGTDTGYVAWIGSRGDVSDVWLARLEPDGSLSAPVRVNDRPGDAAPHLQAPARVAAGVDGLVLVAWQNNTPVPGRPFPASDLRLARSTDGGRTFSAAWTVNDDAGGAPGSHTFHDLVVTPAGLVAVSWLDNRGDAGGMDHGAGGVHGAPAGNTGGTSGADPDAGAHGDPSAEKSSVRVAVSADGGRTFGPNVAVDRDPCPCCRTDLAAGPDGALYVTWRKVHEGDVRDVVVARSADGGVTWSEPVRVHEDGWVFPGCPHAGPALMVATDGAIHVSWYTGAPGGNGLFHAVSRDGGRSFGDAAPLLTDVWVPPSQVDLTMDGSGTTWLAWEDRTGERTRWRLARATGADGPGAATDFPGERPSLAPGAVPLVAWLTGDTVMAARLGGG